MQEADLIERAEHLFANALLQTYQRDGLIDLYHALRSTWQNLVQPSDQENYRSKLCNALQQIKSASLWSQQNRQLTARELEIVREIGHQLAQLEKQVNLP